MEEVPSAREERKQAHDEGRRDGRGVSECEGKAHNKVPSRTDALSRFRKTGKGLRLKAMGWENQ